MAKARQQYFADETSLQKDSREFAIADDVQQKIDSIEEGAQVNVIETVKVNGTALVPDTNKAVDIDVPDVIDNLYTTSSDDALSANQGKLLYDYIQNLSSRGRFLSNWNAATGLPTTNPSENPYTYMAGDYYMVSNVASGGGTNYRPNGSSYTIGQASTTVETNIVDVSDIYLYDGTNWLLLTNSSRQIAIDSSLSTTSTNPVENRVITNELNKKYYGVVSNATPSNPTEGMLWYDTANDILKTYDGANWNEAGTQMVVLSYGNSTWNDFITAYADNAVVYCRASSNSNPATGTQGRMAFMAYVNNATNPTEVEFQYYRSRSDHNSAANQLDQVFVYKLTSASGGTWTVTERNTAAKAVAGTGINLAFGSGNMTISNTGVTSVNGDTGAVTVNDVKVSATAPSSPTEGMLWYDTTNDQLKVYDGTNWNVTGKEYNAGEGIEIGTVQDYSAMRGPCAEGFHVPTEGEWSIMANSLISTFGRNPVQDLKMPLTGYRSTANGAVNNQGNEGDYRSVTYEDEVAMMYYLEIGSNSADVYTGTPTGGRAIRPFKDEYVSPDNTWTIIQGTLGNAGIFRNQSKGLISITDGSVGYTIADKNLGATQVYNYGDTLSEANCGKYYQRGNNYGFPRTGSVTTSSTLVDASNYGPGNYYSSSTYITNNVGWDSSNNANLRGGETGVVTLENAITNTGVLSVNGQTGDVTIQEGIEYNAGEGIEIGTYNDYSAIQGPCPNGFHVPTNTEFSNIFDIMDSLGIGADTVWGFVDYLLMPRTDFRDTDGSKINRNTNIYCWTCNTNNSKAIALEAYDDNVSCAEMNRGCGFSIRPFKNEPVIPDNGWTVLYSGTGDAGVFHNSTDGLISLSSDGTNWITIADKNLGATTVYHYGDTMSESNCGKFYQRGNNYGFPRTGTITDTSSTLVDASGYGPGNYYLDSTFITTSASPYDWSSVQNDNLWGGEIGVVTINDAITNTGVLSVNGQTGDVTIPTPEESNTKMFTITGTTGSTNISAMQEAIDWLNADKCPIIYYNTPGYETYGFYTAQYKGSSTVKFQRNRGLPDAAAIQLAPLNRAVLSVYLTNGNVTSISYDSKIQSVLTTDNTTSYTPTANYNPATKKYVDDKVSDTAYASSWNGVTGIAPSKNAVYDKINSMDSAINALSDLKMINKPYAGGWAIGDDWGDVADACDAGNTVILYNGVNTGYLITDSIISSAGSTITVVAGEETYKVTLDSDYEISAIDIVGGLRKFDIGISEATASTDVTDLVNYLDKGGNAYIHDSLATLDWYIGWYTNHSIYLFSCAYGYVYMLQFTFTQSGIHWYAGTPTSDNVYEFFNPSNAGSTGQVLTKTATGYNWANSGVNTKTFYLTTTGSGDTAKAEAQAALDWYLAGNNPIIIYSNRVYILHSYSSSSIYFRSLYANYSDSSSYSYDYFNAIYFNISSGSVTSTSTSTAAFSGYYLRTGKDYATPYTPTYNGSPATKKYVDDKVAEAIGNDTTGTTTTITKIWAGTETEFANLQTKDSSTIYYTF